MSNQRRGSSATVPPPKSKNSTWQVSDCRAMLGRFEVQREEWVCTRVCRMLTLWELCTQSRKCSLASVVLRFLCAWILRINKSHKSLWASKAEPKWDISLVHGEFPWSVSLTCPAFTVVAKATELQLDIRRKLNAVLFFNMWTPLLELKHDTRASDVSSFAGVSPSLNHRLSPECNESWDRLAREGSTCRSLRFLVMESRLFEEPFENVTCSVFRCSVWRMRPLCRDSAHVSHLLWL